MGGGEGCVKAFRTKFLHGKHKIRDAHEFKIQGGVAEVFAKILGVRVSRLSGIIARGSSYSGFLHFINKFFENLPGGYYVPPSYPVCTYVPALHIWKISKL